MNEKYEVVSVKLQDMPLVPGSNKARKAILKHEVTEDYLTDRYYEWLDFILNRPFMFVLMGKGNLPLFIGIVRRPDAVR